MRGYRYSLVLCLMMLFPREPVVAEAVLQVVADPPASVVVIDHEIRGKAPVTLKLAPGIHLLRVSAGEGYKPYIESLRLEEGKTVRLRVHLEVRPQHLLKIGVQALRQGRWSQAETALSDALSGAPLQYEAYWWLGHLYRLRERWPVAIDMLRRYAQYRPDKPELYLYLGDLYERTGQLDKAVTAYKLAVLHTAAWEGVFDKPPSATWKEIERLKSDEDVRSRLRLAYLYELKGRLAPALKLLKDVLIDKYGAWSERNPIHKLRR